MSTRVHTNIFRTSFKLNYPQNILETLQVQTANYSLSIRLAVFLEPSFELIRSIRSFFEYSVVFPLKAGFFQIFDSFV